VKTWFGEVRRQRWINTSYACSFKTPSWKEKATQVVFMELCRGPRRIVVEIEDHQVTVESEQSWEPPVPWKVLLGNLLTGVRYDLQNYFYKVVHKKQI
jgi:hypothetical protein